MCTIFGYDVLSGVNATKVYTAVRSYEPTSQKLANLAWSPCSQTSETRSLLENLEFGNTLLPLVNWFSNFWLSWIARIYRE